MDALSLKEYEMWKNQIQEREAKSLGSAYDAQKTWPGQGTVIPDPRQAQVNLGPQTYQPKEPHKRSLGEQLSFNEEMLSVLHRELQELYGRLNPLMVPCPEEAELEKERAELNGNIINRLMDQSDMINRMIANVRQAQRDLQL